MGRYGSTVAARAMPCTLTAPAWSPVTFIASMGRLKLNKEVTGISNPSSMSGVFWSKVTRMSVPIWIGAAPGTCDERMFRPRAVMDATMRSTTTLNVEAATDSCGPKALTDRTAPARCWAAIILVAWAPSASTEVMAESVASAICWLVPMFEEMVIASSITTSAVSAMLASGRPLTCDDGTAIVSDRANIAPVRRCWLAPDAPTTSDRVSTSSCLTVGPTVTPGSCLWIEAATADAICNDTSALVEARALAILLATCGR
mmetsp:Transcript_45230/g.106739  ORF Transcript_45230/g.106739 Transcript_45230/m.106739 type:complete len:259 (+) Transcript_45230:2656-3432(+)